MKKILTVLALTAAVPSLAASPDDWTYVAANKDYEMYFKDVERTGDLNWTFWWKINAKTNKFAFGQATNRTEISCSSKSYRLLGGATYAKGGAKIAEIPATQASVWKPLDNHNLIYVIAKELCETLTPGTSW